MVFMVGIQEDMLDAGHVEVVNALLAHKADVDAKDNSNSTPLHWASERGHVEVVNALLAHKADIEAKNNSNSTPLHVASGNGHVQVVNALIAHKAEIEAKDQSGQTPYDVVCTSPLADKNQAAAIRLLLHK